MEWTYNLEKETLMYTLTLTNHAQDFVRLQPHENKLFHSASQPLVNELIVNREASEKIW